MRFSPGAGQHIVMERGQHPSDGPRRIEVADAATGAVLATFGVGFNPRWLSVDAIVAESPDGVYWAIESHGFRLQYVPANRGQLDANGHGVWAVSDLRQTDVQGLMLPVRIPDAREPRIAGNGDLAVRHPDTGIVRFEPSGVECGLAEDSRWSSETLVWWLSGRVWGRTTPDQPTQELRIPGRSLSHPAPFWHAAAGRLWVALVMDDGVIALAEWGELAAGSGAGYLLGQSSGSGFDIDCAPGDEPHEIRVAYFDPLGKPVYMLVDTSEALDDLSRPPAIDPWELALDGTLVTDAFRLMFGDAPSTSPDGRRICLHKNVNEQEWREISDDHKVCYHLFDRSRYPGDVGWYLYADDSLPSWAYDKFSSGQQVNGFTGDIVEMADGRRNRWTHTNTLYGLAHGGVCVQFDPRFPNQDYGPEKCYERQFNSPTHGARWELWYTPESARHLPWGDRSLDVLKQEVESGPPVAGQTPPYIECPRLSVTDDPWAPPPQPEPPTPEDGMTADELRRWAGEIQDATLFGGMQRYHNEVLPRDRPLDGAIKSAAWTDGDPDFWTGDVVTGGANGYLIRTIMTEYFIGRSVGKGAEQAWGEAYDAAKRAYDKATGNPQ